MAMERNSLFRKEMQEIDDWLTSANKQIALTLLSRNALRMLPKSTAFYRPFDQRLYHSPHYLRQCLLRSMLMVVIQAHSPNEILRQKSLSWHDRTYDVSNAIEQASLREPTSDWANTVGGMNSPLIFAYGENSTARKHSDGLLYNPFRSTLSLEYALNFKVSLDGPTVYTGYIDLLNSFRADQSYASQTTKPSELFSHPLWHKDDMPFEDADAYHYMVQDYGFGDSTWSFWREWYQGFLDGNPLDWELQRRVALIPDADWEQGPEHIARLIEDIRRAFEAEKGAQAERHKELEPSSVEHLLKAPSITAHQIDAAAQDLRDAECRYLNDTGANALPEEFQSFPSIAYSLTQISQSIRSHHTTSSVEEELRQQIGCLNARIIALETELDKLRNSKDPVLRNAFKEQAGKSLGDWKMYGALLGAVWMISGDTVGMKTRLENLGAARDAIFGTAHEGPAEQVEPRWEARDI